MLDFMPLWAAILALAVFMYVLLDGFDLGVGMLFLLRRDPDERNLMIHSVAPVWDFNETWLILGGGGLFAVFPLAFAIIVPAVYFPILFMLLGLIFRGVAFEFREVEGARRWLWDGAFGYGSLVATFAQGTVLGMFIQGFPIHGRQYAGTSWNWVAPFPLLVGVGLIFGYALQGSTWLVLKTEGELQAWGRKMARHALLGVIAFILLISLWTPLKDARIAARWFGFPQSLAFTPVPVLTALLAWTLWSSLQKGREVLPFLCSVGLFFLAFTGLVISLWPFIAPPSVTLWDASAAPLSHQFLLIGTMFLLPVIIIYVIWSYWVFRGKVRGDLGYHTQ
ncbi:MULTISPECIES: cytochrome d ubiquinol oxidase subunit II [unclassified Caballeronia]|uniref:cytochrome d ubiquinol oxidase subunit II n=1 Tax=unclassified Caballeronia TaxID=2646786 RepID=UPI00285D66C6|nr:MULTISPECIES: cytochrome d ubiquinol oxidase subunit II [unclassified Caballeronia]MDR5772008.1 cytochrome d ubiquinol oxidase subunit II [Caballeronia sp. LZ002]MDR5847442.1 cytochrome d ubiquinol oxidase subunit II [Caballeronia sp. LZ003]